MVALAVENISIGGDWPEAAGLSEVLDTPDFHNRR
jgi:hypothetical protein